VRNPLCGPEGAAAIYGPQKGATPAMIDTLDQALSHFARIVARDLGRAVLDTPGAGAAGGLGAGLLAFLNADLRPGFPLIAEAAGLRERLQGVDLVITGEGRLDGQTVFGKTASGVAGLASSEGVPVLAIVGGLGEGYQQALATGIEAVFSIVPGPMSLAQAEKHAAAYLAAQTEAVLKTVLVGTRIAR
ncbi:MAG: glycerate kinase, partial [Dehalococcoidia bacterium]